MVEILTRDECGLAPPNYERMSWRAPDRPLGITFHVTVTPTDDPVATWRQIQQEYLSGNNVNHQAYGDIPYNDAITLDGRILAGRGHQFVGAHALSTNNIANRWTLGCALIGSGGTITLAAEEALRVYVYLATLELGHRPLLFDHLDWRAYGGIATSCPDPPMVAFVAQLRAEARAGK